MGGALKAVGDVAKAAAPIANVVAPGAGSAISAATGALGALSGGGGSGGSGGSGSASGAGGAGAGGGFDMGATVDQINENVANQKKLQEAQREADKTIDEEHRKTSMERANREMGRKTLDAVLGAMTASISDQAPKLREGYRA